jgi:diadenylate cyclase
LNLFAFIHVGFLDITWSDIADIAVVTLILYLLHKRFKGSIAERVFIGIFLIWVIYVVVSILKMNLLSSLLGQFVEVGVIAALILFQQEIRKFLLILGKASLRDSIKKIFSKNNDSNEDELNLIPIVEAMKVLSDTNTGALIVFPRTSELRFYQESGDIIDAVISKRLLISIFEKNSPLHDGAVIIANQRVMAARCILPVSDNDEIPANYGLRHRAAIGMSEATDSVILVVSEETGAISIANNGAVDYNILRPELKQKLHYYLYEQDTLEERRGEMGLAK